ncbi:hypothetical protein Glove_300g72 [Diversispora epigaea]|uniref:TLDc domain-containing protein n=1 Tax=Diversispora epigaea TaxID=1348612 RepID=A0A397HWF6_9GLOM|nr:hypothetical protein Glove_300g72 [Diversispora epigaea]
MVMHVKRVVIIKVKGTDEILGGCNPLACDNICNIPYYFIGGKWMDTKESFIFSLKNGKIKNSILSRVKNSQYAICNAFKNSQNNFGPRFGDFYFTDCFSITNYEVFKIFRRS